MVRDPRRHIDAQGLFRLDAPVPTARRTWLRHHGAFSRARGTWGHGEELAEQRLHLAAHLPAAPAGAAGLRLRARFGAAAAARGAGLERLEADRLRRAGRDLVQREAQGDLQVRSATLLPLRALAAPKQRVEAAQVPEIAHEDTERFGEIEVREAGRPAAAQARLAVAVVGRALVGVAQHLVRLGDLFELLLGGLVPAVAVGVVLHRQTAIGLLDVGLGGLAGHPQQRVIVAPGRTTHSSSSPSRRLVWSTSATILS